ncbi:hypothetical protein CBR_g49818 [Chara braunii]|uniref:Integrase catalytic domain-containing protein n=1 Tax=Chara braunii TaxID=69332 RepID=A0A388JP69_CHABU|nr:hypothetical protein CBR_g49818 [Chara braunii]|eukprot:GBG59558.1 hypothetical protein CBR_g49818 [Chara braunii]
MRSGMGGMSTGENGNGQVEVRVELGDRGNMRRPLRTMTCVLPPFLVVAVFETTDRLEQICRSMAHLRLYQCARQDFFRLSVEMGPFGGNWAKELAEILNLYGTDDVFVPSPVHWRIVYRDVAMGETYLEGLKDLFFDGEDDFRQNPMWLLGDAEARARQAGEKFANKGWDGVSSKVVMGGWKEFRPPCLQVKTWVPEFVDDRFGGFDHVTEVASTMERIHLVWQAGFEFADPEVDDMTANLRVAMAGSFHLPSENIRMRLPPFLLQRLGGLELVRWVVADLADLTFEDAVVHREYYRAILEMGSFNDEQRVGKGMTSEEEAEGLQSKGSQDTDRGGERNEGSIRDRESAKPEGTREDGKNLSTGESSGKTGGSKRGPQENKGERGNDRSSPRNSEGTTPKKTKVSNARRKLAKIEKRTAEYKARLIEEMMAGNERDLLGEGSREERRASQGEVRHGGKDNSHRGTPSKKGKEKGDSSSVEAEKATTPPAIDNGASRLPATPKVTKGCDGLWSLRERVLGWFDPEGTPKAGEKQRDSKEGEGTSTVGEAGSSEGGLKRIVATLTRALNKNQGYLADAKKKLTFDGTNITEFLIDYENLAALLKWTEEDKIDHLGQHVSLSLGRDIMAIVAASGSWKEPRNEMMRKYLKAEKMATEAELAAVQRKNYATYNDFRYCTMTGHFVQTCPRLNHDIMRQRFSRYIKGEIFGPQGERINWNSPRGMRCAVIILNNLDITVVEAKSVADIVWDQPRGRGPQVNFILEGNGQDRVNITTRRAGAENKLIRDTVMEEVAGTSANQGETETEEPEKVYRKAREEEPIDKAMAAKNKFRYQIPILTMPELDDTLNELLGTMVSVSFQTMLQASPRLLKGLRQLLTRPRVEVEEAPEPQEQETEEAEAPQGVSNLQRIPGDLEDLEKAFADIRLSLPDREGGEVMRAPPGTKLSFHALPVGKLKVQIGTHHTDALVDGGVEITLIRRDFTTITGCTVNKEVTGSIRGAGGEIPFAGYVTKCSVKAGIRESIWSFQQMTVMEEMNHDIILGRPWCANVEMIGMRLHDGTFMVDIEDPVTGRGELLRLLGTGGDPPKGKLATWSPTFEDSARKGAFARMEGMREKVEIMIEEAFSKKEWIKMGLPLKKRRQEDEVLRVMVAEKESEVELGASLPKPKEDWKEMSEVVLEIPDLLQLVKAIKFHKVGVEPATLAKFEDEVRKGYCLNGKKGQLDAKLIYPVRIHTVEHECWNDKGHAYEFGIAAEVTELLRAKIDSFVAEPTASPYTNKWFVFRKPNKMLRWIQDLQKLNAVTIRDEGSLPQADLLAESHAGRSIYSLIDLYSGYDQPPLDARDRPYTDMHTPIRQLQMQVTPMGFTNAVAEAQRRMLAIAGDMFPEKCESYIDDNPTKGAQIKDETEVQPGMRKFVWDHLQDIKDLLQRFLVYNITASGPKSILAVPEVTILGFRCGAYGRKPDPAKMDKISQWPTPLRTTTEARAFLGMVGFWRIFVKGFAKIAEPIRAMIREGGTMEWTEDREAAVQTLKDVLSSDQVTLAAPSFNDEVGRPFILETDGGPLAVRGVLIQRSEEGKERPIRFESKTLNSAERRYSQFKKEVLAILHCLNTFQAYLFGRRFILRIHLTNVAGALKNYKPIDPTVGRWIGFIWQFDYKVERIAGLRNRADGLSRVCITPEGVEDAEPIDAFLKYEGGTLVVDNEMTGAASTTGQLLIQTLEKGAPAVVAELREGPVTTIRRKDEKDSWGATMGPKEELMAMAVEGGRDAVTSLVETWTRRELQCLLDIIQAMHDGLAGGHRSSKGTLAKIAPLYFWYILDARDNLSGYVEAVALKRKTGKGVADWIEDFYLRHPFVRRFIADNETEFVNHEVLSRFKTLCVPIKIIEPYHPEAGAPVERGHRTLKNTIDKLAADDLGNWSRYLKQAVFSENMTSKRTTGCIPAELWYGREIDFPVEALVPTWNRLDDNPHMFTEELIVARCQQVVRNEEALEDVVKRVMDSRMRDKARWDQVKNIRKEPLQVGEMVLVRNSALESTWSGQLGKRFKGPYRIAKRVGLNTFELEDLDDTRIKGSFSE